MSINSQNLRVTLYISGELETEEIYEQAVNLKNELLNLNVEYITLVNNQQQRLEGAKSGDPITIGAIALGITVAIIPNLLQLIQSWLLRQKDHSIKVKIGEIEMEVPRSATESEINEIINLIKTIPHPD
jgi:hypothetical protein